MKWMIRSITYNWHNTESGETHSSYTVGFKIAPDLECSAISNDGETNICDVYFSDGTMKRIFNVNTITYWGEAKRAMYQSKSSTQEI